MVDVGIRSEQGRRSHMEDGSCLGRRETGLLGGVFDGHCGSTAVEWVKDELPRLFWHEIAHLEPVDALATSFRKVAARVARESSGTTATVFYLADSGLWYAHVGDSRLLVVSSHTAMQVTTDHRVDDLDERHRVLAQGATISYPYVMTGYQGLMMTRSLGDAVFKDVGVIDEPETGDLALTAKDRWIVAGTDGLFDMVENREIPSLIDPCRTAQEAADLLVREALDHRAGDDNVTCLVVRRS